MKKYLKKIKVFAMLPWLSFLGQGSFLLPDNSTLTIGLGETCQKIQKTFVTTVVSTPEGLQRGLSHRHEFLNKTEGMLFVFQHPKQADFWMKDTFIPLQIGFFNEKGMLIQKHDMSVEQDPNQPKARYHSQGIVKTALEIAPGELDQTTLHKTQLCIQR